ncbi:MAG: hypothetical protein KDM63_21650, partial [Verrucomicrobiae bacterium]|nr:hypothetical protein [Verrucomicrobiae bacterium]
MPVLLFLTGTLTGTIAFHQLKALGGISSTILGDYLGPFFELLYGKDGIFTWERFGIVLMVQSLMLGTHFFALIGLPTLKDSWSSPLTAASQALAAAIWGFTIPFTFLIANAIPKRFSDASPTALAIGALMLILTVAGWFRSPRMVRDRLSRLNRVVSATRPSSIEKRPDHGLTRFGGIPYLFAFSLSRFGLMMLAILAMNALLSQFMSRHIAGGTAAVLLPQLNYFAMFFGAMTSAWLLSQFRLLQSLPFGTRKLTHLIILLPATLSGGFATCVWM